MARLDGFVIARSHRASKDARLRRAMATKQSRARRIPCSPGLLRSARNDGCVGVLREALAAAGAASLAYDASSHSQAEISRQAARGCGEPQGAHTAPPRSSGARQTAVRWY